MLPSHTVCDGGLMMRVGWWWCWLMLACGTASGADVFRCAGPGGVAVFQSRPCPGSETARAVPPVSAAQHSITQIDRSAPCDVQLQQWKKANDELRARNDGSPQLGQPECVTMPAPIDPPPVASHERSPGRAPINEGAISERMIGDCVGCDRSKAYARFTPYQAWAAEVARRLPNCAAVTMVSLSLNRSTPNEPVFYVTCSTTSGQIRDYFNTFYSVSELDAYRKAPQP